MKVLFRCPVCQRPGRAEDREPDAPASGAVDTGNALRLRCSGCGWSRPIEPDDLDDGRPRRCLVCGCEDLWRQKDFPQRLGLAMVALGIVLSTIAWAYKLPVVAIGVLLLFALIDLVLFAVMSDVLVCYRCGARHKHAELGEEHPRFDLETAERYRQERKRLEAAKGPGDDRTDR